MSLEQCVSVLFCAQRIEEMVQAAGSPSSWRTQGEEGPTQRGGNTPPGTRKGNKLGRTLAPGPNARPRADAFQAVQPWANPHNFSALAVLPRGGCFSTGGRNTQEVVRSHRHVDGGAGDQPGYRNSTQEPGPCPDSSVKLCRGP